MYQYPGINPSQRGNDARFELNIWHRFWVCIYSGFMGRLLTRWCSLWTVMKTGESGLTVFRLLTKENRWKWVQANARLVYKNGKPDYIIATQRPLLYVL